MDAPAEGTWDGGKFLVTFPYPYMNGKLHLGHAFSLTKAEFAAGYQRMLGKKALFPFAFHCTGMPIQAAAFKLRKEYELYGSPIPNFPPSPPEVVEMSVAKDAAVGEVTIGWKAPTSTGGNPLTGFVIMVRKGEGQPFADAAKIDAPNCAPGEQFAHTVGDLPVGAQVAFVVAAVLGEGGVGAKSKVLEKSADGKHMLCVQAPKGGDKDEKKGGKGGKEGGGGAPAKKPAAKIVAKTGGMTTQWDILRSMGLSAEDCVPFTDPTYWLQFFPPLGKKDLIKFGCCIDWRRTFLTTDYNPYYDSFVRWQFLKLRENGDHIAFGKRPSIFSEADGQPCMDHDRDKGEGVAPQEYVALKLKVLEPFPEVLKPLAGKTVYCLAGTLRPETMCGQTNCWILPEGDYGAFEAKGNDVYVCAQRAARNMSFQDILPEFGTAKCLLTLKGSALIGCKVKAPSTKYEFIHMLPLTTISMTKGTAIVTSVPSDSPDDYAAFMDLKNPKKREFYGVKAEWVEPFELIPIIDVEIDGEERKLAAEYMCQKLKVQSQKDVEKLKEAHDVVYTAGFYKGVMSCGDFVGKTVQEAKPLCKKAMCDAGEALTYLEPEGPVFPRSTPEVECVVALVDQWYLKYGAKEWAAKVLSHVEGSFECYNAEIRKAFTHAVGWLGEWACSRSFGLGTRMPWDEKFLIESLSDSTIYMAYYLVAHHLQGGVLDGRTTGPMGITPDQCTPAFWDMVMTGKPNDGSVTIPAEKLATLRREVSFWYPMDLRVSGKDLIPNHLTMSLYNHAAVWKDDPGMWPLSMFCNGHVQVDAEKMSKSKGNFITMEGAMELWGSDATRFACADAGDGILNANYDRIIADRAILTLTTELEWVGDVLKGVKTKGQTGAGGLRAANAPSVWLDTWFANEMIRISAMCGEAYASMRFKEELKCGFYLMQEARDRYRAGTASVGADEKLVRQWAEWQALMMMPITPHWSEALWELLGKPGCCVHARWPTAERKEDLATTAAGEYLFEVAHSLAAALVNRGKKKPAKGAPPAEMEKPNQCELYVATSFPRWKEIVLDLLRAQFDPKTNEVDGSVMKAIPQNKELAAFNKGKQVPQFAAAVREEAKLKGAAAFALKMPFDELALLTDNLPYLCSTLQIAKINLVTDTMTGAMPDVQANATPGKPQVHFFFSEDLSGGGATAAAAAGSGPAKAAGSAPAKAPAAAKGASSAPPAPAGSRQSVFDYLEGIGAAKTLNEAVNQLGIEQPADPYGWLASYLQKVSKERGGK